MAFLGTSLLAACDEDGHNAANDPVVNAGAGHDEVELEIDIDLHATDSASVAADRTAAASEEAFQAALVERVARDEIRAPFAALLDALDQLVQDWSTRAGAAD